MNLGEFRSRTNELPDNTELVIWDDLGVTWNEMNVNQFIPATPIHPAPVCVVVAGQQIELEFDLAVRTGIDEEC